MITEPEPAGEQPGDRLLLAVAALGGDRIDPQVAGPALRARSQALESIAAMRAVPLSLIDAIEPGHASRRLSTWTPSSVGRWGGIPLHE